MAENGTPEGVPDRTGHCCGPRELKPGVLSPCRPEALASPRWEDDAHQLLVDKGAALLLERESLKSLHNSRVFHTLFWGRADFKLAVRKGLCDADYESPWQDPVRFKTGMFAYHFCDPDTRMTMPFFANIAWGWAPYNAISEGQRYFYLSVHAARRILRLGEQAPQALFDIAADYLGLALHFFTDLTQPMHAANFANTLGEPGALDVAATVAHERIAEKESVPCPDGIRPVRQGERERRP